LHPFFLDHCLVVSIGTKIPCLSKAESISNKYMTRLLSVLLLQKVFLSANAHKDSNKCKPSFSSPSIMKDSVEGEEPMDWISSSE
jgi:hypothetical protein